jgi:adenine/guanine/hypoxanthine permease
MSGRRESLWVPGDWNAFFGFGTNSLVNVLVLTGLLRFVLKMPDSLVFGRILPATGLMLFLSTVYYAYLAYRLAKKTGRTCLRPAIGHQCAAHVCCHFRRRVADPRQDQRSGPGLGSWSYLGLRAEFVLMAGGFIAPVIRNLPPRAALLGSLAGISITAFRCGPVC